MLTLLRATRADLRQGRGQAHADPGGDSGGACLALALRVAPSRCSACRRASGARPHAAPSRPAARGRSRRGGAVPEARHCQPDALVQGPGGRGRCREGARARLRHARLLLDRQPGERRRRAGSRRGDQGRRPLSGGPRAGEAHGDRGVRGDDLRGGRDLRRLQPALGGALVRGRLGIRQRRASLLLRRGIEDDRVRDRRAARLAPPGRGDLPDRLRSPLLEGPPGLRRAA